MTLLLNFQKNNPPPPNQDNTFPRPFVPSIEKEDIQKSIDIGYYHPYIP